MKPKTSTLRLYAKLEEGKSFDELNIVWLTNAELKGNTYAGYVRVKNIKRAIWEEICNT